MLLSRKMTAWTKQPERSEGSVKTNSATSHANSIVEFFLNALSKHTTATGEGN